jgi:serine/threonine protein kinase
MSVYLSELTPRSSRSSSKSIIETPGSGGWTRETRTAVQDDLTFSIQCLGVSFLKWYQLERNGLAQAKYEHAPTGGSLFGVTSFSKSKFQLLLDVTEENVAAVDLLGESPHSVVYGKEDLAYKIIRLNSMNRDESIIGSLRELALMHSFGFSDYVMHPIESQWILQNGRLYQIIHKMRRARCTLYDSILRREFTGLNSIKTIMSDVLMALLYLHDRGVVHGDVKPQNILLNHGSFHGVLSDFTLTHFEGRGLIRSAASVYWKAPELDEGKTYTSKSDVWSWGVVWMDCLHGRIYFKDEHESLKNESSADQTVTLSEQEAKEFEELKQGVLNRDPELRWSVTRVMEHPWFKQLKPDLPRPLNVIRWEPSEQENLRAQAIAALFYIRKKTSESWVVDQVTVLSKRMAQHLIFHSLRFQLNHVISMCVETVLFLHGFIHPSAYENDTLFFPRIYHVFHILRFRLFNV